MHYPIRDAQVRARSIRVRCLTDPNFWSVRVSSDLRIIVHRSESSLLLCYGGHHDDAYAWAERRKIERHPTTGAAQLVEVRETVREVVIPKYVEAPTVEVVPKPLFAGIAEETLLSYGVPREWVSEVRDATEAMPSDAAGVLSGWASTHFLSNLSEFMDLIDG